MSDSQWRDTAVLGHSWYQRYSDLRVPQHNASPPQMVRPETSSTSFPPQDLGGIYLGAPGRPTPFSSSSSVSSSHSSEGSPRPCDNFLHYESPQYYHDHRQDHQYPSHSAHSQARKSRPDHLLPPHRITLPGIDELAMSAVLTPSPAVNGAAPDANGNGAPRMSMTSREWVIPPRPKPGRKPATDTPPTKRKAQNRAAQRAFRERRAARVGELEEQLDQQKEEHDKQEIELKDRVRELELEVQSFRSRCLLLEDMLEKERKERIRAETEREALKRRQEEDYFRHGSASSSTQLRGLHQSSTKRNTPGNQHHKSLTPTLPSIENPDTGATLTCGKCSPDRCACVEEVLTAASNSDLKRPSSPSGQVSDEKRRRGSTSMDYSRHAHQVLQPINSSHDDSLDLKDGCGFCKDGTYCVCADDSLATPALTPSTDTLPPITQPIAHQAQTPPPSEPDTMSLAMEMTADGAVKLPRRNKAAKARGGCGANGPGSCAQCQADPKSGLFCRLMAAKFSNEQGGSSGGCCGGKGPNGGCCKSKPAKQEKITLPSLPSLGLSCAEAYQTLSSHRNFDRASDDIGSWLPKLRATPVGGRGSEGPPGRIMPVEVEAASIMSVLKEFDIRFGTSRT